MTDPDRAADVPPPSDRTAPSDRERRRFVAATGATIAAGAAGGVLPAARSAFAGGSDAIRVGLVGCGGRGTGAAYQALSADPGATLVAMGDVFPERLEASLGRLREAMGDESSRVDVPEARRFVGFDAYKDVIDACDVVLLATPPHFRPAHLAEAVGRGRHVFAEKPMAVDAPGVRSLYDTIRRADEKGLSVVSGFCWRYGNAERAVFDEINGGGLGDVVTVHTTYHSGTLGQNKRQDGWSDMEWQLRNWWHFTWLSGDHIVEQACHSVDRLAWATGDRTPVRCVSLGGRQARQGAESGHVYDHFAVVYEYDDGKRCFHTCRQMDGTPSDNTDYVYGTEGSAVVNGWIPRHEIMRPDGTAKWSYDGPRRDMYQNEHDALFASIRAGDPINDGEQMTRSTLMSIMGRMAAYTGQVVTWEQALESQERLGPETYAFGELPTPTVAIPGRTRLT